VQPLAHDRPDPLGYDIAWSPAIDHHAAPGFFGGEGAIGLAKFLVKVYRLCLEPVRSPLPPPGLGASQADFGGNIKDERELGDRGSNGYPLKAADQPLIDVAQCPLIDAR
jgi:hypothetical protein